MTRTFYQIGGKTPWAQPTGFGFGPGDVVVCYRHQRQPLQPVVDMDVEKGYASRGGCPYCKDGPLYKQYHKHRSITKWWDALSIVAVQNWLNTRPIEPYWDSTSGLSEKHITKLIEDGEEGRFEVEDELYEGAIEYIWELEQLLLQEAIEEFELETTTDDLRHEVYPIVSIDLERIARYTNAYLALRLPVEHYAPQWTAAEYQDFMEELEWLGVNPTDIAKFFQTSGRWYDCPTRTDPLVKPKDLVDVWTNCFYVGNWYAMLKASDILDLVVRGELQERMTLKKGARLVIHDYLNGASSTDCNTLRDIEVETKYIFNDGENRYGIQSCCGYCDYAWESELEVI